MLDSSLTLFQFSHCLDQLRQLGEGGDGAAPLAGFEGRGAGHEPPASHVAADAALGVDDGVVVDGEVAGDADLPGQQHVLLEDGTAGQARLGANDVVLADDAGVADLDQVVDLGAALDARLAHGGAVHEVSDWISTSSSITVTPDWTIL